VEQDDPFDPLNIGRIRPGTVIPGTYGPHDLLNQFGPGLISRIIPVHVIGILEAGTTDPSGITSKLFIAFVRSVNYIQAWLQIKYQASTAWNVSS